MSIPFFSLYDYINNVIKTQHKHQLYIFSPPGEKNLFNLIPLDYDNGPEDWGLNGDFNARIPVICHDQEPLNYNLYKDDDPLVSEFIQEFLFKIKHFRNQNLKYCHLVPYYQKFVLIHSEVNSDEVSTYEQNGFIPVFYWSHALIALDWFRYARYDAGLHPAQYIEKDFLIYNRAWTGTREYRLKFAELLVDYNLVNNVQTKFQPNDGCYYHNHQYSNNQFKISPEIKLEEHFGENLFDSTSSAIYDKQDINSTLISIVLETMFDDSRIHLTEKILRPIACGHPFMVLAGKNSLEFLKSYGFETFAPYINESYDSIEDPLERLTAVVKEMKRIALLSDNEKNKLKSELLDIARYNKELFFSDKFFNHVIRELKENACSAIEQASVTGDLSALEGRWNDPQYLEHFIKSLKQN